MKINAKRTAAVGGAIAALALGGTGIALAQDDAAPAPSSTAGAEAGEGTAEDPAGEGSDGQEPTFAGSVPAPAETDNGQMSEAEESATLEGLATITPEEAAAAALAVVPGSAGDAELGNENGFVVYDVTVTAADGTTVDVKVDAGNGQVLAQETDGEGGEGPNDD